MYVKKPQNVILVAQCNFVFDAEVNIRCTRLAECPAGEPDVVEWATGDAFRALHLSTSSVLWKSWNLNCFRLRQHVKGSLIVVCMLKPSHEFSIKEHYCCLQLYMISILLRIALLTTVNVYVSSTHCILSSFWIPYLFVCQDVYCTSYYSIDVD